MRCVLHSAIVRQILHPGVFILALYEVGRRSDRTGESRAGAGSLVAVEGSISVPGTLFIYEVESVKDP
jgi:hypothetical protein